MDDTNPEKETDEFVNSIIKSVRWLGFDYGDHLYYASDYFDTFFECAKAFIRNNLAYVDSQNSEQIRENRGTLTQPGLDSKFRDRSVDENLEIFEKMKTGLFQAGEHVLRAKIDMKSPNLNMRDPILYKIRHVKHHRQADKWCIYPLYDFAHPLSDAIEKITHSICTLEFEDHRPIYNWVVKSASFCGFFKNQVLPRQFEFARLNIESLVLSKRKLTEVVDTKVVKNWSDPRMPTLEGAKTRGYPPEGFIKFNQLIGVTKSASTIEQGLLEECMREHLNKTVKRKICVISPLRLVIENVEENFSEDCFVRNHPQDKSLGERIVQFGKNLYIERSDFQVNPAKDFFRLRPGGLVRLKYAFVAECTGYEEKDGLITSVTAKIFKDSKSGTSGSNNYKVKGNIHWLNESTAKTCILHIYHNLFTQNSENLNQTSDEEMLLNKHSLETLSAFIEQSAVNEEIGTPFQFERHGYFILANKTNKNRVEFGKIISLKDSWKKC